MIESPVLQEIIADCKREAAIEARQKDIVRILVARFGAAGVGLDAQLRAIDDDRLEEFVECAATCPDLDSFREQLSR
jgi:hypothetical protein